VRLSRLPKHVVVILAVKSEVEDVGTRMVRLKSLMYLLLAKSSMKGVGGASHSHIGTRGRSYLDQRVSEEVLGEDECDSSRGVVQRFSRGPTEMQGLRRTTSTTSARPRPTLHARRRRADLTDGNIETASRSRLSALSLLPAPCPAQQQLHHVQALRPRHRGPPALPRSRTGLHREHHFLRPTSLANALSAGQYADNAGGSQCLASVAHTISAYLLNTNVQLGASCASLSAISPSSSPC
jgi:hypothetical protein